MANDSGEAAEGDSRPRHLNQPAWFTPERLLLILCWINLLNYVDRGAIASNGVNGFQGNTSCVHGESSGSSSCFEGSGIVGEFSLSYFQDGVLSSAFMVGLLIASPIFAELSKTFNPMRLIGVGLSVWTVATAGCAISIDFWTIALFRTMVGVAEASFISLAAPFIDDYAPPGWKTAWLSLFYSCIPVGIALGYVYGGLVGGTWGWRIAFWVESIFMLPIAIFGFLSSPVHLRGHEQHSQASHSASLLKDADNYSGGGNGEVDRPGVQRGRGVGFYFKAVGDQGLGIWRDVKKLSVQKVYVLDVVGYVAYNFVVGAYAYWGPKVGEVLFGIPNADVVFGGLTIVAGIFGTLFGGFALDRIGCTIPTAFKFLSILSGIGGILCLVAFSTGSLTWFIPLFGLGEFAIFATQGPVNFVTLHSVPPHDRPIAIAISTVAIHIFGDVPSSPLVGLLEDFIDNWRLTSQLLTAGLLVASVVWGCGSLVAPSSEEELNDGTSEDSRLSPEEQRDLLDARP